MVTPRSPSYSFSVHIVLVWSLDHFSVVCIEASMTPPCLLTQLNKLFIVFLIISIAFYCPKRSFGEFTAYILLHVTDEGVE